MPRRRALPGIEVVGIDVHIGSQLTELAPYEAAFAKVAELTGGAARGRARHPAAGPRRRASASRTGAANEAPPLPFDYGEVIRRTVGHLGCEIEIEPGRLIAGNAGVLLARVIYLKRGEGRDFLILDAAMNDLIRPAMYDAWHDIVPVVEPAAGVELAPIDVVGPVCETGDTFAAARDLPPLGAGDLVAFRSAGAYGAVMASEYNSPAAGAGGAGARAITMPWCGRGRALTKCSTGIPSPTGSDGDGPDGARMAGPGRRSG